MTTFPRTTLFAAALLISGAALAQAPAAPSAAAPAAPARPAAPATPPAAGVGGGGGAFVGPAAPKQATPAVTIKDTGLAGTQSVKYDLYFDRYLVANSAGYITTINPDTQKVDQLKFIENGKNGAELTAPSGIYIRDGLLYVADATKGVRVFDLITGKQTAKFDIPGAIALTAVAVTADRIIFVADSGKTAADGAVYKVSADGKVSKIVSGATTKRPIGLDININRLDKPGGSATVTYVTADASDVVTIDQTGKEISRADLKVGKLNSVSYTDNGFLIAEGQDGTTYYIDVYNHAVKLQQGVMGGAGVAWDWVRNKLLIAQPSTGLVVAPGPVVSGY